MRVYKPVGSTGRLLEVFQKVNGVKLNEDLGFSNRDSSLMILKQGFDALKNNKLSIQSGGGNNTTVQMTNGESIVQINGVDDNKNNYEFTFKINFNEGDQEGVFDIQNVQLKNFKYHDATGAQSFELDENALKNFSAQFSNDLFDIIEKYVDVQGNTPTPEETSELEEAVKLIDAIKKDSYPYGGGSDRMQTGKHYGDEKPTNPKVRVKSPELDKFIQETELQEFDKPAQKLVIPPSVGPTYTNEDEDDEVPSQELKRFHQELDTPNPEEVDVMDEPVPDVSPEKQEKIFAAYDALVARNKGRNPNYSPTTQEIVAELDRMAGVKKPQNTRVFPKEAEPYLQEAEFSDYPEPLGKEFKPKEHIPHPKKKHSKKVKLSEEMYESTDKDKYEDVVFLQGDEAYQPLEILDSKGADAALEYLKQWHNPGEHQGSQVLGHGSEDKTYEKDGYIMSWNPRLGYIGLQYDLSKQNEGLYEQEEYGDDDISNLPAVPSGYGEKGVAQRDMKKDLRNVKPVVQQAEFNEEDQMSHQPMDAETDELTMSVPAGEMDGTNNAMYQEPETDDVEQLAQDKEQQGELIPGGKGEGKSPLEFSPEQILMGMKVEMEHTDDPMYALEITIDHLSEDPEYYTSKETPEDSAQANASADASGEDKEMTDMLLGFKPHNVGDEIEGGNEEPEPETPEIPAEEPPVEPEPEEKKEMPEGLYENQIRIAKKTLSNTQVSTGMSKKDAVQIMVKHLIK